ncbi:septum formation initiator family protein [uncultured Endozoicomonas sp.]|uniref:FtsB family cell division protein n=1 Tax=uncultured Endozoicomonas sp. TaxID=432652 RepID=UPI002623BB2B|nr:septum formation initiator family protein [uncultured Endozoicomonas sp.]
MKKWVVVFLTLSLVYLQIRLWVGEGSVAELITQEEMLDRSRLENERLYQRNRQLAKEVVELQQGMETVESRARQELGMVRRDETFFLIYD